MKTVQPNRPEAYEAAESNVCGKIYEIDSSVRIVIEKQDLQNRRRCARRKQKNPNPYRKPQKTLYGYPCEQSCGTEQQGG